MNEEKKNVEVEATGEVKTEETQNQTPEEVKEETKKKKKGFFGWINDKAEEHPKAVKAAKTFGRGVRNTFAGFGAVMFVCMMGVILTERNEKDILDIGDDDDEPEATPAVTAADVDAIGIDI